MMMRSMMTLRLPLFLVVAFSGCEKPVTYSYFLGTVKLDKATVDQDLLDQINSCAVIVSGADDDQSPLTCQRHKVKYDLGKFDFATTARSGSLRFTVIGKDFVDQKIIVQGTTDFLPIITSTTQTIEIVMTAVNTPDGGAPGGATDSGSAAD